MGDGVNHLARLRLLEIGRYISAESFSFKLILLYLVMEYLRPQDMYPILNKLPVTMVVLLSCTFCHFADKSNAVVIRDEAVGRIVAFFAVVVMASFLSLSFEASLHEFKTVAALALVYFLTTHVVDSLERFFVFFGLYILLSFKLSQCVFFHWVMRGFQYDRYGASVGSGWLENSGELAIQMCLLFANSVYFALAVWKEVKSMLKRLVLLFIPVSAAGSVIACGSRGSFLALAAMLVLMWIGARHRVAGGCLLLLIVLSLPLIVSERDWNRTSNMTAAEDTTASNRIVRWRKGIEMIRHRPLLGVGYGNWATADRRYFNGDGAKCHNIFIECASELGLVGLVCFLSLVLIYVKINAETMRIAAGSGDLFPGNVARSLNLSLVAYLVAGFFVTVLYYPYFWVCLALTVSLNKVTKRYLWKKQ